MISMSSLVLVFYSNEVGNSQQKENEKHIRKIDAVNNDLVDACNWDVPRDIAVELCDNQMKQTWNNSCQKYKEENLTSCPKVEAYLHGRDLL